MNAIFCSSEARSENNDNILEPCCQESNNTNKAGRILARGLSLQNMLPNSYVYFPISDEFNQYMNTCSDSSK